MKNKILFSVASLFVLAATSLFAYANDPTTGDLADPNKPKINCYCPSFLGSGCKVTNKGELCAQSEPGGNVQCSSYKGNC